MLILAATACGITDTGKVTLRFEGTVTAQATGQPIAGAQIRLFEPSLNFGGAPSALARTTTDSQGNYSLTQSVNDNCRAGVFPLEVEASASGFTAESEVVAQCNGTLQRLDFALTPFP